MHADLKSNWPDVSKCNRLKAVFLEKVVQVLAEHLKHKAGVSTMSETLERPDHVERSGVLLAKSQQDGDLDLSLASVRRMVLQYLYGHNIVAAVTPTLHHLTEGSLAKKLQHLRNTAEYFFGLLRIKTSLVI